MCRGSTIDALGKLGSVVSQDVKSAVAQCLQDQEPLVRQSALFALSAMEATGQVEAVRLALRDPVAVVRAAAIETLGYMASISLEVQSICSLAWMAEPMTELLANAQTRYSALVAVQYMGNHKVPGACVGTIVDALRDGDSVTRQAAAAAVGSMADAVLESDAAVSTLKEFLQHPDCGVRAATAHAAGAAGTKAAAFAPAVAALLDDEEEDQSGLAAQMGTGARRPAAQLRIPHCAALVALGKMGDVDSLKKVSASVSHENWEVRMTACEALGYFGEEAKDEVEALITAAQDSAYPVRAMACYGLGEIQSAEALPTLVQRFEDKAHTVRVYAVSAVGRLGAKAEEYSHDVFKLFTDPVPAVQGAAAVCLAGLGEVGQSYAGVIAGLLYEADVDLRCASLQALAALGDHGAAFEDEIFDCYYSDPSSSVRKAASSAIAALGLGGVEPMALALQDEYEEIGEPVGDPKEVEFVSTTHFEGLGLYFAEIQERKKELQSSGKWVEGLF